MLKENKFQLICHPHLLRMSISMDQSYKIHILACVSVCVCGCVYVSVRIKLTCVGFYLDRSNLIRCPSCMSLLFFGISVPHFVPSVTCLVII